MTKTHLMKNYLLKNVSVSIHYRNIQALASEFYKTKVNKSVHIA